ncbi:AbiJ-NTD4 domain-containing protein [Myxococcus fulvus]|uniref:AbiJ-NTD4 domain-containing protein n=1 Tax=Myxococcus fulvus TaxID=33 RepID=UPI003B9C7666
MTSFSQRHGYSGQAAPITVREDAPEALRHAVVQIAAEEGFRKPSAQRALICRVLRAMPNRDNWTEYPNVADEVANLITTCKWFRVYDIAEAFYAEAAAPKSGFGAPNGSATEFESKLNEVLYEQGIGWKMERGQIVYRGDQPFEQTVASARHVLQQSNRSTAQNEVAEALRDLSRRPAPDRTGAIQHSMAALECVARDISGDPKQTLGAILKNHGVALSIPRPLDAAVEKAWGYASEVGRHLQEGREPSAEEAELVTTVCAAVVTYLVKKHDAGS